MTVHVRHARESEKVNRWIRFTLSGHECDTVSVMSVVHVMGVNRVWILLKIISAKVQIC